MSAAPAAPPAPSSNAVLRTALRWGLVVTIALAVIGGAVGYLVAGTDGLWSALVGVAVAAVFLAITAISILVANRWFGQDLYVPLFFGIVLGGWIVKFVLFLVVMLVLRGQPWVNDMVLFLAIVAAVLGGLAVDVVVMLTQRQSAVSDIALPESVEDAGEADATGEADAETDDPSGAKPNDS